MKRKRDKYECTIFIESYIAHPYWPAKADVIDITKKSGTNRARSEVKREAALKGYLKGIGMSVEDFHKLEEKAARQWYRLDNDDEKSPIIIPRHQLAGMLVEAVKTSPASIRGKYRGDSFRHQVRVSDFITKKKKADGIFRRFVKLEMSNQRSDQANEYIEHFEAKGTLEVFAGTKVEMLENLLSHALDEIGVGASRVMGYGRGELVSLELL